jgi:acetyltransferase-like isoleucine patch superfamily enzyme
MLTHLWNYVYSQASSLRRYALQELVVSLCAWVPSLPGIALRAVAYRLIMQLDGWPAFESGVRLAYVEHLRIGRYAYIDRGVYLHACPGGIEIGDRTFLMHNAELHVFNFRALPHAFIKIGARTFVGESAIIRGQGGVTIGEAVLIGPGAQILAVNHDFADPELHIMDQGISGEGIVIEDGAWVGAGAIVLDGVRIGQRAVVGANAVVTHDVPPRTLVVGAPARVVKQLDDDSPEAAAARAQLAALAASGPARRGLLPTRQG